ncbi:MAG: sigma-70 family RNA polymerase sigma factor [Phycisphaerae bacterium]|nr:sigma-70 family RNA polymerase sigma factor [Phycisphaerae bacterium]
MDAEQERELTALSRQGDRAAYAGLVRAHSGRVFAICLGMLGNRHDAEDAAQQTLLRGFVQIQGLRDSDRFAPWIARIARNLCLDTIRRSRRRVAPMPRSECDEGARTEDCRRLEAALAKLDSEYRVPLLLFYFDGRNTRSIAETLGATPAAIQTRLSRGRRQLRTLLTAEGGE